MKFFLPGIAFLLLFVAGPTACDRMITPRSAQVVKDAQRKVAEGEFIPAINLYESALDGSERSADIHYQLALIYDDKMNEPLHALHHFKRYLTLAPAGAHAADAKNFMKRDELAAVTNLSGDTVVTRAEAARLRNENLNLRRELDQRNAQARPAGVAEKPNREAKAGRSHVVQAGDTLFSLSRQYYNSPDRWKDIMNANKKSVDDPGKLRVGQTLTIP